MPDGLADHIYITSPAHTTSKGKKYRIIFITGNPGLIEYYRQFLTHLHALLSSTNDHKSAPSFTVSGSSLIGFETSKSAKENPRTWKDLGLTHDAPFSLAEVIDVAEKNVLNSSSEREQEEGVILVGHSVGAYIMLEIIDRHRKRSEKLGIKTKGEPRIVGGVCLFPTVVDIGVSRSGKSLTRLSKLPFFQTILPVLISLFLAVIPTPVLRLLVQLFTGFHAHSVETTTAFLKSKHGAHQCLHMGADEMRTIKANKWDAEIWGAAHPSPIEMPRPKLFFYWGESDHWVANRTRDDLMALRGRNGEPEKEAWKPKMEIDTLGIPHAFPDAYSVAIAEKVWEYVDEIVSADERTK